MRTIPLRLVAPCLLALPAMLAGVPGRAGAQMLVNGSFEDGPVIPLASPIFTVGVGATALTGWTVTGGAISIVTDNYWVPLSGHRSVELSTAAGPGAIQQNVTTVPGGVYRLTFWLTGEPFSSPTVKNLRVTAGAVQQDFAFDNTPAWHWDMAWARHTLDFTAATGSTTLRFSALDASAWCASLDSMKVELVSAGVPEGRALSFSGIAPDPVGASGTLSFTLPEAAPVRLSVLDPQGREVALLADGVRAAGPHHLQFSPRAHGLSPGMYFASLRAGPTRLVRRFVVLH